MDIDPIIISTSLEALIERATRNSNERLDSPAMMAFSGFVQRDPVCVPVAAKFILAKIHSMQEWEALQALHLLDICMQTGSTTFQAEVGKFKFLNELIRLVSPKYTGIHTPELIKNKIVELLSKWASQFPKEVKIQDAFDMLKKQGVVKDLVCVKLPTVSNTKADSNKMTVMNEEKSLLLQKLLKSKNPNDLKAANELIKSMVYEEEQKSKKLSNMMIDIEIASNNVKLLSEMLKSYQLESSSSYDLELINELHNTIKQWEPKVQSMLSLEIPENENIVKNIIQLNYEIKEIFKAYSDIVENPMNNKSNDQKNIEHLLDLNMLSISSENKDLLSNSNDMDNTNCTMSKKTELDDFFQIHNPVTTFNSVSDAINKSSTISKSHHNDSKDALSLNLFEELNNLGRDMLNKLNDDIKTEITSDIPYCENNNSVSSNDSNDEPLLDADEELMTEKIINDELQLKPLGDLTIKLEEIIPCAEPVVINVFNKNEITTDLHLAANKPRDDITVFVATTKSRNKQPIINFLFQPIIPENCRLRVLPPSRTNLSTYNAFLPQESIIQIILVATRNKEYLPMKFVISYTIDNEMFTEFGEIEQLRVYQ
ncbi:ADP-ribosylation factor-binding protein GGA1 isoform X2 [Adelges cooleyi]|uniref:ADP-ribosylation factor-binding protein GGA1 isoform X2 n=1 Tax=Adelges cooleyi TaxID=133065 RepID=UPI00217F763A|nr:ADP-ribosylation factor-binding protein GGA1 isoform X2 [Adelges cooleyi]